MFRRRAKLWLMTLAAALSVFAAAGGAHATSGLNLALNASGTGYPNVTATGTCGCDSAWKIVNGIYSYQESPRDRWTNYGSPNASDWVAIDFGAARTFNQIKLYLFNDGGGVQPPASYVVEYWDGSSWAAPANQTKSPLVPTAAINSAANLANTVNTVDFDTVTSQKIRVTFNKANGTASGLVELEVFDARTLLDAIAAANQVYQSSIEGTLPGQYSLAAKAALAAAIAAAKTIADDTNADQSARDAAEAALDNAVAIFQSTIIPLESVYAAISNEAGTVITLYVSNALDTSYEPQTVQYNVYEGANPYAAVSSVSQNRPDNSIRLVLGTPLPANADSMRLKLSQDAFRSDQGIPNASANDIPITQASQLDWNEDRRIGIDDLAQLVSSESPLKDIDRNGTVDKRDLQILLKQIMPVSASPT